MTSSFICGATTNAPYHQAIPFAEGIRKLNCTLCKKNFALTDRVHNLACHVFHSDCLQKYWKENSRSRDCSGLPDVNRLPVKWCPRSDCLYPIELYEGAIADAHNNLKYLDLLPPEQMKGYCADLAFNPEREQELSLMKEYIGAFGASEELKAKLQTVDQRVQKLIDCKRNCERAAVKTLPIAAAVIGATMCWYGLNWAFPDF